MEENSKTGKTMENILLTSMINSDKTVIRGGLLMGTAALAAGIFLPMSGWERVIDFSLAGANYVIAGRNYLNYRKEKY
jgi:hypothetical protein